MADYDSITESLGQFNQLTQEANMARAYIRITQEMGPSPQLIAFVNYDNVTEDSVGLESFNIMDQHEQIIAALDPDALDGLALESLGSVLKKVLGGYLIINGAITMAVFGIVLWPLLLAGGGALLIKSSMNEKVVPPVKKYKDETLIFETNLKKAELFASSIPTTLDQKAWNSFHESWSKINDSNENHLEQKDVPFKNSGWTVPNAANASKWLNVNKNKLEEVDKKIGAKFAAVEKLVSGSEKPVAEVAKMIAESVKVSTESLREASDALHEIGDIITKVCSHLEKK